ncbi:MAG: hypothetical protein EA403_04660 [Spirochaetaceae bacterium]|nr:MAG: hypothetical protein EA403_04660 [Spirochaetaceae bacterium]
MSAKPNNPVSSNGEIRLYETADGHTCVEGRFVNEMLRLARALVEELFKKDVRVINEQLGNISVEGERDPGSVVRNFRITASDRIRGGWGGGARLYSQLLGVPVSRSR